MAIEDKIAAVNGLLEHIVREYPGAAFATSFGAEDMVLLDFIARGFPAIEVFTLDTGRLPEETHRLMQAASERYAIKIKVYYPEARSLENFVASNGIDPFYRSVELRRGCCHIRKVEPLKRALEGKQAWITGLRRDQALSRSDAREKDYDAQNGLYKFNPLVEWTLADTWDYIRRFDVPYNALHDRGYPSIGCAPCTRAVTVGEDPRAGRWWWESPEGKECGLHPRKPLEQSA